MPPKFNLSELTIHKLIQEIKNRECLWNAENEDYNDRFQTALAWKEISETLQLPVDLVRMKWKNLRDSYKKEMKKSGASCIEEYNGRWQYMEVLSFIDKPDSETNTTENQDVTDNSNLTDNFVDVKPNNDEEDSEDPVAVPKKRRRSYAEEEYDLMFLKSLAPFFRRLDPVRKLVLRSKMQDLVINEIAAQKSSNKLYML
ncbi:uncharacterized protein LOC131846338 [Achroia grisella]|uniref:uncharacterized protein LOC131846338 n=1 Tax=Achroia grisella TaxID=688607 RepID=UPI0027D2D48C|nr:uncharacterized protein LOC131846338 [Achroia grisella]